MGVVLGCVSVFLFALFVLIFCIRKKKRKIIGARTSLGSLSHGSTNGMHSFLFFLVQYANFLLYFPFVNSSLLFLFFDCLNANLQFEFRVVT